MRISSSIRVALILVTSMAVGCSKSPPLTPTPGLESDELVLERADYDQIGTLTSTLAIPEDPGEVQIDASRIFIPPGSVDALAAAIAAAKPGAHIILRAGTHTENGTVTINKRVSVIGEPGAELVSGSGGPTNTEPQTIQPALYVRADHVVIQGLAIRPSGLHGNTAILVDNAKHVLIHRNSMDKFQFGILVEDGDHTRIWDNDISSSTLWQTNPAVEPAAHGIVVINGKHVRVFGNDVRNGLFGIWACSRQGQLWRNSASECFLGIILCKVPDGSFLIGGVPTGARSTAVNWLVFDNATKNNVTTGILATDGANHNRIESNLSTGNGTYDVELAGATMRFGFLAPTSSFTTFVAGRYPNTEVKNCGVNNRVIGGNLVDNSLEPCD